jgi:signal transduction histidine kinase/ActR/RegA family two-component response regulator
MGSAASNAFHDDTAAASASDLRRCIRDILGLLALHDAWRTRDERGIFVSLLEALEAALPITLAHLRAGTGDRAVELLRAAGSEVTEPSSAWWHVVKAFDTASLTPTQLDSPAGCLYVTYVPLGYRGADGGILLGSLQQDFPSVTASVTLRAAASVADSAVHTARLLDERERALRAKDEFLAMLGHELRNPLAPITTAIHLMRMRSGGQLSKEMAVIDRQVRHLTRLVDDLLDIARITRGKIDLNRGPIEVDQLLAKALETASPWLDRAKHRLQTDVEPGLVIDCDAVRISQVLANLLTNAAKYTPPGGLISVKAQRSGSLASISVRDNGIGIPPEAQAEIFDIFTQVPQAGARSEGGLGIGLALVKTLVELHGGRVTVYSQGIGTGSTFTITLPLAATPAIHETTTTAEAAHTLEHCRILLVDDNIDAASALADVLRAHRADVILAHDSVDALMLAKEHVPDVALLDIELPVMDGYQLAAALRHTLGTAAPRLFALTGYGRESDFEKSRTAGFAGHFVKPVEVQRLIATVAGWVQRRPPGSGAATP